MVAQFEQIVPDNSYSMSDEKIPALQVNTAEKPAAPGPTTPVHSKTFTVAHLAAAIPGVNSAVNTLTNFYETSKSSSPLIKYGAETVESGVRTIYRPIHNLVEPSKSDNSASSSAGGETVQTESSPSMYESSKQYIRNRIDSALSAAESAVDRLLPANEDENEAHSSAANNLNPSPSSSEGGEASQASASASNQASSSSSSANENDEVPVTGRMQRISSRVQGRLHKKAMSRWNGIYGKSYEGLQTMREAVNLMQVSQTHIDRHTVQLTEYLRAVQNYLATALPPALGEQRDRAIQQLAAFTATIKKEIVTVLRRVVDIVSRSATSLPSYAQARVKEFILLLPSRWGAIAAGPGTDAPDEAKLLNQSHQVVTIANETLNMLRAVTAIFIQYLERATRLLETINIGRYSPYKSLPEVPADSLNDPMAPLAAAAAAAAEADGMFAEQGSRSSTPSLGAEDVQMGGASNQGTPQPFRDEELPSSPMQQQSMEVDTQKS